MVSWLCSLTIKYTADLANDRLIWSLLACELNKRFAVLFAFMKADRYSPKFRNPELIFLIGVDCIDFFWVDRTRMNSWIYDDFRGSFSVWNEYLPLEWDWRNVVFFITDNLESILCPTLGIEGAVFHCILTKLGRKCRRRSEMHSRRYELLTGS